MADANPDNKKSDKPAAEEDEELTALLESAVDDFEKIATKDTSEKKEPSAKPTPPDSLWTQDFQGNDPRINPQFASLFSPDGSFGMEELSQELARLAEATAQTAGFDTSPDADFTSIISETLRNLSENAENMQGSINDEALLNMLQSMPDIPEGDSGHLMSFMKNMMQGLLSKDILHPAISGIVEKYPAWLDENRAKLPAEEVTRYEKQLMVMKTVCADLEAERPDDSEEVKKARFEKVLESLQEMQSYGQPPADLVAESGTGLDEQTAQLLAGRTSTEQCVLQ